LRLTAREWAIVALGAGAALPFGVRLPSTGTLPVDVLVWPVLVVALVLTGNREWAGLRRDNVARLLAGYIIASAASLPIGIITFHNTTGVRSFLYGAVIVANFAAGYLIFRSLDDLKLLVRAYVVSIGAFSLGMDVYLLQSGALVNPHSFHNSLFIIAAIYGWPNAFSVLVAVGLVMAVHLLTSATGRERIAFYAVLTASLAACLILTFSKTGWVCAAVAAWLLVFRFWSGRRQLAAVGGLLTAGVVLYFVGNESLRTQLFTVETLTERFRIVADVFRYVNPLYFLVGSGSQSLETLLASHADVEIAPTVGLATLSAHDEFVNVLVKGGVVSLICFVAALVLVMLRTRQLARAADTFWRYWYASSWAVIASLFTGEELRYWPVGIVFWLVAGASLNVALRRTSETPENADRQPGLWVDSRVASKPIG
jgi:O-Antigen ligase